MSRFEIEDIISQDKRGIVFCAHDSERGHTVALRRFFPFGQDGGGLSEEESAAFVIAAKRLDGVEHDALRSVIAGSVDPIDGMPYIVAQWIEGGPLETILTGGKLEPPQVIELLRLALEVSLTLSEALGEESVWVETEADSIFIGSEESCRGYVFWLSPFKWLGAEFGSRKLSALVDLGERLAGWKGKLISDSAGNGLGGWLKWMRNNPDARLAEALQAMPMRMTESDIPPPAPAPPPPKPSFAAPVASEPAVRVKQPPSISPILIAACVGLLLAVGGLAYFRMSAKSPDAPPGYAAQTTSPSATDPKPDQAKAVQPESAPTAAAEPPPGAATPETNPQPAPEPAPQPAGDAEARPLHEVQEMIDKQTREKEAQRTAALAPPAAKAAPTPLDLTPGDGDKVRKLKAKGSAPASVTGILRDVRLSSNGKGLYFDFSKPADFTQIMGIAHNENYKGAFSRDAYADLIGRKVRFDGTIYRERSGRQFVKIREREMIKVLD